MEKSDKEFHSSGHTIGLDSYLSDLLIWGVTCLFVNLWINGQHLKLSAMCYTRIKI